MEVCSKSVMGTQFLHFCITGYEIRALTISLLHLKMVHYDWIEEETQFLASNKCFLLDLIL